MLRRCLRLVLAGGVVALQRRPVNMIPAADDFERTSNTRGDWPNGSLSFFQNYGPKHEWSLVNLEGKRK